MDSGNRGKLKASSDLQALATIVTAKPYFAVTQPGDVVVMENVIRPDTVGKVEEVVAKLRPRGHYTYVRPPRDDPKPAVGRNCLWSQYAALHALCQALNAIQIGPAGGAGREAGETMRKAEKLYVKARNLQSHNAASREVVTMACHSVQTAEDARAITAKGHP
jgi:hypothetical protein